MWPPFLDESCVANMHLASNDLCDVDRPFHQGAMDDALDNGLFDYDRLLNNRLHNDRLLDHRLHNTLLDNHRALCDWPPDQGFLIDVVNVKRRSTRGLLNHNRTCPGRGRQSSSSLSHPYCACAGAVIDNALKNATPKPAIRFFVAVD